MSYNLYNGNCLEVMKDIPDASIDMILCDLPYGTTACSWDIILPFDLLWKEYDRICKPTTPILLFGQEPFSSLLRLSNIKNYKYDYYWEKERLTNIQQVKKRPGKVIETISVFYKKQCFYNPIMTEYTGKPRSNKVGNGTLGKLTDNGTKTVREYKDNGLRYPTQTLKFKRDILVSNLHPTQKPVELLRYLIKTFSKETDIILDNTMGSGSVGVAALRENRNFIGIELDKQYFDIAKERITQEHVYKI